LQACAVNGRHPAPVSDILESITIAPEGEAWGALSGTR